MREERGSNSSIDASGFCISVIIMFAFAKCANPEVACAPSCTNFSYEEPEDVKIESGWRGGVGWTEKVETGFPPSPRFSSLEHPAHMELEQLPHAIAEAKAHGSLPAEAIASAEQTYTERVMQKHAERQASQRLQDAIKSGESDQGQPRNAKLLRTYTTVPLSPVTSPVTTTLRKGVTQVEAQVMHPCGPKHNPPKELLWAGPAVQVGHEPLPLPLTPRDTIEDGSDYVPLEGKSTTPTLPAATQRALVREAKKDMKVLEFAGAGAGAFDDKMMGA